MFLVDGHSFDVGLLAACNRHAVSHASRQQGWPTLFNTLSGRHDAD